MLSSYQHLLCPSFLVHFAVLKPVVFGEFVPSMILKVGAYSFETKQSRGCMESPQLSLICHRWNPIKKKKNTNIEHTEFKKDKVREEKIVQRLLALRIPTLSPAGYPNRSSFCEYCSHDRLYLTGDFCNFIDSFIPTSLRSLLHTRGYSGSLWQHKTTTQNKHSSQQGNS